MKFRRFMSTEFQKKDWLPFFPHTKPRKEQIDAIDFTINTLKKTNKRFVVIEAGTGVGKSAVGLTVSRYLRSQFSDKEFDSGAYFLTTQKILQDQYVKDFGSSMGMKSIKSSTNYQCGYLKQNTCAESMRALRSTEKESKLYKACTFNCIYKKEKERFLKADSSVTNFPYFLAETNYSGKITPREILVIDEAHNAAEELSKFIEVVVTERFSKQVLKLTMPKFKTQTEAFTWINSTYHPKLSSHIKHIEKILEKYSGLKDKLQEFVGIAKQFDMLDKHACKLNRFLELYQKDNWVANLVPAEGRSGKKIEFKPIDVSAYAENMLFRLGKKIVCMSATILNIESYCTMLGIKKEDCEFISIPSPFPIENRPIIACGVGSMSSNNIENTLPRLAQAVREILKNHPNEKGIIHCHTFKIANYLKRNIRSQRLITHDSSNRDDVLKKHIKSKNASVLLSPSMTEGVDLKGDCSRFQIICKIPYPYLGDKLIRKKMNKWRWWYPLKTAKTIVQASGRSVRSIDDNAITYILDSDWSRFYGKNKKYFPEDFSNCIS